MSIILVKGFGNGKWAVQAVEYLQGHFIITLMNPEGFGHKNLRMILKKA